MLGPQSAKQRGAVKRGREIVAVVVHPQEEREKGSGVSGVTTSARDKKMDKQKIAVGTINSRRRFVRWATKSVNMSGC